MPYIRIEAFKYSSMIYTKPKNNAAARAIRVRPKMQQRYIFIIFRHNAQASNNYGTATLYLNISYHITNKKPAFGG